MLQAIARLAISAPRKILTAAFLVMVGAVVFGFPVIGALSAGGFEDPSSESSKAQRLLAQKFDHGDMEMIFTVTSDAGAQSEAARTVATEIVAQLQASPAVTRVSSAWTVPPPSASDLITKDGKTGLIIAGINGGETALRRAPGHWWIGSSTTATASR